MNPYRQAEQVSPRRLGIAQCRCANAALRYCISLTVGLLAFLMPATVVPASIPDTAYSGRYYFSSTDPRPVRVLLRAFPASGGERTIEASVPRSYLINAEGYDTSIHSILPDTLRTSRVRLAMRVSTRRAYVEQWKAERPVGEQARAEFRADSAFITLRGAAGRGKPRDYWIPLLRLRETGQVEGLTELTRPDIAIWKRYFDPLQREPFDFIDCLSTDGTSRFCDYSFYICPSLFVEASFPDFRLHGGVAYARDRIALLSSTIKSWTNACDATE